MPTQADFHPHARALLLLALASTSAVSRSAEPSAAAVVTPPAPPSTATAFTPTPPAAAATPDAPLTPTAPMPAPAAPTLPPVAAQPLTIAPPDERPAAPVAAIPVEQRANDPLLHQGLDWNYCGPRPGMNGFVAPPPPAEQLPIEITADLVDYDQTRDLLQLRGDIDIVQDRSRLRTPAARYQRTTGEINASDGVLLEHPGLRLIGAQADYNLQTERGHLQQVGYRLHDQANLRGAAQDVWLLDAQRSQYRDVLYTTCPPGDATWSIRARDLELNQDSGLGTVRHARLQLWNVPVFYTPYLMFPIDGRRHSGFLIPEIGSADETGLDISIPYYWNIAPNTDATLTPRIMSERGFMLGAEVRHLSPWQRLEFDGEILPEDRANPDAGIRGALHLTQFGWLNQHWSSAIDFTTVSDADYFTDFGNRLELTSVRNLSQRADVIYSDADWWALARVQQFQTIDSNIAPANRPYEQLPHLEFHLTPQSLAGGFDYAFEAQYDYFDHQTAVHGSRFVAIPTLRWPFRRGFGHLIPRARLYYTHYDLTNQRADADRQLTHLIPSFELDGKLIFERETDWFGQGTIQTLEPRFYYVRTAYADQADNPLFDTTALEFSFASLFRPNRFTGYDRIGDENRLTLGLTSRTIANRDGDELVRVSLGQIHYFDARQLQLNNTEARDISSSPLAAEFAARLTRNWSAQAGLQWNPHHDEPTWEKQVLQLRYRPDTKRLFNLAYRYNLGSQESEQYEDTDLSFQMPVGSQTRLVGRWLYSLLHEETVEAFAGVEFGQCCWRLRVLGQHLKRDAAEPASTSVMLQLELAGLGAFGNSIDKVLERGIYGYQTD